MIGDRVHHHHLAEVDDGERRAGEQGDAPFLEDDAGKILELNFAEGNTADDRDACLVACVAAGVHQHRDARKQHRADEGLELHAHQIAEMVDDELGEDRGDH